MKAVAYGIKSCEKELLIKANKKKHEITLISNRLDINTAAYADGKQVVIAFPSDDLSAPVLRKLKDLGVKYIATRSTGTDHIDIAEASRVGIQIANVPAYSPESVAEHALALLLALSRNLIPAHDQMKENDFRVDNLVGSSIRNKTVGVIGYGKTGSAFARILRAFGARVLIHDLIDFKSECYRSGFEQLEYEEVIRKSDIVSFHVPLNESTYHMVNKESLELMKKGVTLINVSRGAVFNTKDVLEALQNNKVGKLGIDVYEFEHGLFFFNHTGKPLADPLLKTLIEDPRVLITPHQAFLTEEALHTIAEKTIENLDAWNAEFLESFVVRKNVA